MGRVLVLEAVAALEGEVVLGRSASTCFSLRPVVRTATRSVLAAPAVPLGLLPWMALLGRTHRLTMEGRSRSWFSLQALWAKLE